MLIEKVQGVRVEFVLDPVGESGWTDEMQWHHPMQADAQQSVEARKMIHMSVGHERMADAQELARR